MLFDALKDKIMINVGMKKSIFNSNKIIDHLL